MSDSYRDGNVLIALRNVTKRQKIQAITLPFLGQSYYCDKLNLEKDIIDTADPCLY